MQSSLAITALIMGVLGGPHCVAMCGAACAGLGQAAGERRGQALLAFQLGRLGGYSLLGALAAVSVQGLGWLTTQSAAIRPVWTLLHLAALALGFLLMVQARQPVWLDGAARQLWARVRNFNARLGRAAPWMVGGLWALMPCGLLYSALMVAALTSQPLEGAATMALFALGQRQFVGRALVAVAHADTGGRCLGHARGWFCLGGRFGLGIVDGLGA